MSATARKEIEAAEAEAKRRKVQRACDVCRRKKIRCEGPMNSSSSSKCANCQEYGYNCTYVEAAKRRGPPKGYVDTIEQRCARLEKILEQLHPGFDFSTTVGPLPDRAEFDNTTYNETLRALQIPPYPALKPFSPSVTTSPAASAPSPSQQILGPSPWKTFEQDPNRPADAEHELEDVGLHAAIHHAMSNLDVKDTPWRFHGKASPHHLCMAFNEMRFAQNGTNLFENLKHTRRAQYWQVPEWENVIANEGLKNVDFAIWPEPGLDDALIDAYFTYTNFHFPLLNHLIFKRQYASKLYKASHDFAKVCIMVFANGSQFVDDPRVYWPRDEAMTEEGRQRLHEDKDGTLKYSAGWKYLRAMLHMGRSVMKSPNLFDFQCHVLMCSFLMGSAVPHLPWVVSGMGLRAAQEIGIHVRSILLHADPIERALYNRAFWCLYHIDRLNCAAIGRSVALQDTDFDADYPIAVDDEYWDTGDESRDFVQPPGAGVPHVAAFIHTLKLDHIIGAALRTIYAINKPPEHRYDANGQRAIVVELDSALNSWADAVPDGLRWDPTRGDQRLFEQSAILYVHYYYCQILIHRPFIPTIKHPETIGLPSLAICSNASRSICNIIDAVMRRKRSSLPGTMSVQFLIPTWVAAIVLLISVYTGKQQPAERDRTITDYKKCVAAMKDLELTWRQAGKLNDFLSEIARDLDGTQIPVSQRQVQKRAIEPTEPITSAMAPYTAPAPYYGETLFDTHIFDPFLPDASTLNPAPTANETDIWAQLFAGYMQNGQQ